jgi:uncharacterized protein
MKKERTQIIIGNKMKKPFDIGNSIVSASVAEDGKILTVNRGHKEHGFIKLAPIQSFANENWYEPEKVREYRNSFLSDETAEKGIGLIFDFEIDQKPTMELPLHYKGETNILYKKLCFGKLELNNYLFVPPKENILISLYDVENYSTETLDAHFSLMGEFGIIRASYGQITENGPIPIPETENCFQKLNDSSFKIIENGTCSSTFVKVIGEYDKFNISQESFNSQKPLTVNNSGSINIRPGKKVNIALVVCLNDKIEAESLDLDLESIFTLMKDTEEYWKNFTIQTGYEELDYIVNRNFAYSYGCCFLKEFGAMITDHQSLPLTWNRDNYFMFKLMEQIYKKTENLELLIDMRKHVEWLYTWITKEGWGRSHLVNGKIKDRIFQFDQQCYPILELYDYLQIAELPSALMDKCLSKLDMLSDMLLLKKGCDVALFETDENPADDPVLYPYHFSTQILAWKTFNVLDELNEQYHFSTKNFGKIADEIQTCVFKYMITVHEGKKLFCYTTDAKGSHELYHDANDLPTVLGLLWNFIDVNDEVFQNTVDWAFSKKNRGYYSGKFGGLGSDHAKGHWPLGSSQLIAIAIAKIKDNNSDGIKLWKEVLNNLKHIAMKDGLFSESVYPDSGEVFTRYWFAWPGAIISWLYLLNIK